jgi:hypothetical protein
VTHRIAHSVPVVYNRLWIDSAVSLAHNVSKLPVIHGGVDAVDVLVLYVLDAWAKPPPQHGECGEVQFRVAMRIRIMFLDLFALGDIGVLQPGTYS